jgi:hypothetical protein
MANEVDAAQFQVTGWMGNGIEAPWGSFKPASLQRFW